MPKQAVADVIPVPAQRTVIAIKVNFELNTPDQLRRVMFGLEKDNRGTDVVWKLSFQLFERQKKTEDFGAAVVALSLEVDTALNSKAEAAAHGLTPQQAAHALGPAADDAKAAQVGEIAATDAKDTVQNTLAV